jgi:hypothetical protein
VYRHSTRVLSACNNSSLHPLSSRLVPPLHPCPLGLQQLITPPVILATCAATPPVSSRLATTHHFTRYPRDLCRRSTRVLSACNNSSLHPLSSRLVPPLHPCPLGLQQLITSPVILVTCAATPPVSSWLATTHHFARYPRDLCRHSTRVLLACNNSPLHPLSSRLVPPLHPCPLGLQQLITSPVILATCAATPPVSSWLATTHHFTRYPRDLCRHSTRVLSACNNSSPQRHGGEVNALNIRHHCAPASTSHASLACSRPSISSIIERSAPLISLTHVIAAARPSQPLRHLHPHRNRACFRRGERGERARRRVPGRRRERVASSPTPSTLLRVNILPSLKRRVVGSQCARQGLHRDPLPHRQPQLRPARTFQRLTTTSTLGRR